MADAVAPVLRGARLPRRRFRAARGSVLTLRSSEAATLTIALERAKKPRGFRRAGSLTRRIRPGAGRTAIKRRLRAGRYRLTPVAVDAAGNRSKPLRLTFTVLRAR